MLGEEIARGMTLLGPQRDELRLMFNGTTWACTDRAGRPGRRWRSLAELEWRCDAVGEWSICYSTGDRGA